MFLDKFKFDRKFLFNVLKIAIPLMLQQLIISSVNLVDNLMVGHLGDEALGAVSSANRFYMISNFATFGITMAASVFMAQYYGAKNFEKLKESFRFMLLSAFSLNLVFFLIGKFAPNLVLGYFTDEEEVIRIGLQYMNLAVYTFLLIAVIISVNNAIRAMGDSRILVLTSLVSVIINICVNYCLILGNFGFPRLGVVGAAIGTLCARSVELCLSLLVLKINQYPFNTKIGDLFKIEFSLVKKILSKAIPLCTNEVMWSFGIATIFKFYSTRGLEVMSGYSAAMTFSDLFFTLFGGMSMATTVFVSQKLGANQLEEARDTAYKILGVSVVLALIFSIGPLVSSFIVPFVYTKISVEAKAVAQSVLRVQTLLFWVYMFSAQCYFILRSGGDMKNTLVMDSGFMWLVNIPLLSIVTYFTDWSYLVLYLTGQSVEFIKLSFAYHLLKKENWVRNLT